MKTILIIDDDIKNYKIMSRLFIDSYNCEYCKTGKRSIEILSERYLDYSAVLLDLMMPEMSGIDTLKKLYELKMTEYIPVIIVSAYETADDILDAYNYGAADILHKPIVPAIAKRRLDNLVTLYHSKMEASIELVKTTFELNLSREMIAKNNEFLINALGSVVEFRSNESGNHIKRVKEITKIILNNLVKLYPEYNYLRSDIEMISQASALHDVGKIAIPDAILNKPGKFNEYEFNVMKMHTTYGCEILEKFKQEDSKFYKYCYDICRWHHEKYDGNGYPDHLVGEQIPVYCQAVSVADCFDALVSKRVYKEEVPFDKSYNMILNGECGQFSDYILASFIESKDELLEIAKSDLYK